jgi:hypothetical protein
VTITASSIANPGYVSFDLTGDGMADFTIQWGSGFMGTNTTATITFPVAFTSFAIPVVSGGNISTGSQGDVVAHATGLSSASIKNSGLDASYWWIAVGR